MVKKIKKVIKNEEVETEKIKKIKARVIGIGGGGGNVVSEFAQKVKRATFLAANTDLKALKEISGKVGRFQFGESLTKGLGTGMNASLGEMTAQNEKERIKRFLQGQDLVILIACLGGGVSSGATPVFAKISHHLGNLTYGIFTLPFKFEGQKKMEMAQASLKKVKPKLNAITILPNQRIFQTIDKTTPLKEALSVINKSLAESLQGLIETIYQPTLINIDFADLKTIFQGQGKLTYLHTAQFCKKEGSAKEIMAKLINSPLYPYNIERAKGVLFNVAGGKNSCLAEIGQISKTISELVNKEAKIIFGLSEDKKYQDVIKITLLATGCKRKIPLKKAKKKLEKKKTITKSPQPVSTSIPLSVKKESPQGDRRKIQRPGPKKTLKVKELKKIKPNKITSPSKIKKEIQKPKKEPQPEPEVKKNSERGAMEVKVRKNALQVRKEMEKAEKEMLEKEKFWEIPTFLRKKFKIE